MKKLKEIMILLCIVLFFFGLEKIKLNSIETVQIRSNEKEVIKEDESYEIKYENDNVENITKMLKEQWYSGFVINKNNDEIIFEKDNRKFKIQLNKNFTFRNLRTNEEINYKHIKEGDYIDTYYYFQSNYFGVIKNIKEDELKNEIIKSFAFSDNLVNPVKFEKIIEKDSLILATIQFGDLFWYQMNSKNEKFEMQVIIDENTKYKSDSDIEYDINLLIEQNEDIIIKLDPKTIEDETPRVLEFYLY